MTEPPSRDPGRATGVEAALAALRPPGAHEVPEHLLLREPLLAEWSPPPQHPFDAVVYETASAMAFLRDRLLVFDLDDTLLNTNFICRESWDRHPGGGPSPQAADSIDYGRLRLALSYWLKAGWRRPRRARYDSRRYPFLRNPEVIAQLRPGMVALLHGLREAGARLVLMTVCARKRLDFLFARLPALQAAFREGGKIQVVCAEDLAGVHFQFREQGFPAMPSDLPEEMVRVWKAGIEIHDRRPQAYGLKTLPVLFRVLGLSRMDLLVDDSESARTAFHEAGLNTSFLKAPRADPYAPFVAEVLAELARRFAPRGCGDPADARLPGEFTLADYPWIRFEDPLYYPLVHTREELSA